MQALVPLLHSAGQPDQARKLAAEHRNLWQHWDHKLPGNEFVRRQIASLD